MGKNHRYHIAVAALLGLAVVMVLGARKPASQAAAGKIAPAAAAKPGRPRLVDLGADKCIPCKMMAPVLEQLKKEQAGKLTVEFIDVWKNPAAGEQYGIRLIPTQIFYDAAGKEFFRHEGFFPKEEILKAFKKQGIPLAPAKKNGKAQRPRSSEKTPE